MASAKNPAPPQKPRYPMLIEPKRFGEYTLVAKLGRGGMAEVFLGYKLGPAGFRKPLVIKRILSDLESEPRLVQMFFDEARLAARLNHPNVVQTYAVDTADDVHFLAMEYLQGQSLHAVIKQCARRKVAIPVPICVRIMAEVLDGLSYAHHLQDFDGRPLGVVHRDVSPQNIFVTFDGQVKVLDFGIAKATTQVVETREGAIKGKYAYMAPEQALAETVDVRADIWSAGVVLWELLAGRRLFKGASQVATLRQTLEGQIPTLEEQVPGAPVELQKILDLALHRELPGRYADAVAMRDELEEYLRVHNTPVRRAALSAWVKDLFEAELDDHQKLLAACLEEAKPSEPMLTPVPGTASVVSVTGSAFPELNPTALAQARAKARASVTALTVPERPDESGSFPELLAKSVTPENSVISHARLSAGAHSQVDQSQAGLSQSGMSQSGMSHSGMSHSGMSHSGMSHSGLSQSGMSQAGFPHIQQEAPKKRSKLPLIIGGLLLLVIGAGGAYFIPKMLAAEDARPPVTAQPSGRQGSVDTNTSPNMADPAAPDPAATGSVGVSANMGSTDMGTGADSTDMGSAGMGSAVEPAGDDTAEASGGDVAMVAPPVRNNMRQRNMRVVRMTESAMVEEPPPPPVMVEAPPAVGRLSLDTTPWSEVFLGSRSLGTTPLRGVSLPVGRHRLRLVNEDRGIRQSVSINVTDGGHVRRRVALGN